MIILPEKIVLENNMFPAVSGLTQKTMSFRKIIIASTDISIGGQGLYIYTLASGLKNRGWDVHLLVTNACGNLFDRMKNIATRHDLSEHPLSIRKIFTAAELVNNISPDILLMNNCKLMHYSLPLIKTKIKPIAVLHSDDVRFYKTAIFFGQRIFRWIAPTKGVFDRCKEYLKQEQRMNVRIIPHGIDMELFSVNKSREKKISGNICFLGFIAQNKGADLLPDILIRVSNIYKDIKMTIVGYGPLKQTIKSRLETSEMRKKFVFTGAVNHEEVPAILRDSDIFLLPTRIEGFGLGIVEAMLSGVVPVVSRLKGITDDIVSDGVTGLLIDPDDTEGFADAILSLLNNPEKLLSMSEAAREEAAFRYSAEKMLDAYEALFAEDDNRQERRQLNKVGWLMEFLPEGLQNNTYEDLLRKGRYLFR